MDPQLLTVDASAWDISRWAAQTVGDDRGDDRRGTVLGGGRFGTDAAGSPRW
jgi:hypothetical protein